MSFDVDKIKAENDIHSVARRLGLEVTRGGSDKAMVRCFRPEGHSHGDRTPSAVIDGVRQTFRCWVCDEKPQDVIGLVMVYMGCDFKEACEWLGGKLDAERPRQVERKPVPIINKALFAITKTKVSVLETFINLCDPEADETFAYMKTRGIRDDICIQMGIVYCRSYLEVNAVMRDKFSTDELRKAGLVSANNESGNLMPFGNRIIYPFYQRGRVVYLQGRSIEPEPRLKKLSLGGTIPFLYNVECLSRTRNVCLCEGCEDTITAIQMGYEAVGILGVKGFKEVWAKKLRGKKVYIMMDNDVAGREATEKIGAILTKYEIPFVSWTERLPEGYDLNEWYTKKGGAL